VKRFELTLDIEALLDEADKDKSGYIDYEEVRFLFRIAAADEANFVLQNLFSGFYSIASQILLQLLQRRYPSS
jgi:hypothetical protein